VLKLNPKDRLTPAQALAHPFITNEPFVLDWIPPSNCDSPKAADKTPQKTPDQSQNNNNSSTQEKKRIYLDPSASTQNLVSYRPYISDENPDDRNKFKNVSLLNNQTESNKPATARKKLNPNKEFIPSNFPEDSSSKKLGLKVSKNNEYTSEPGSATSFDSGIKKNLFSGKNRDPEYVSDQDKNNEKDYAKSDSKVFRKNLSSDNLFEQQYQTNNLANNNYNYQPYQQFQPFQPPMQNQFQPQIQNQFQNMQIQYQPPVQNQFQPGMQNQFYGGNQMPYYPNQPQQGQLPQNFPAYNNNYNTGYNQFQNPNYGGIYNQPPNNMQQGWTGTNQYIRNRSNSDDAQVKGGFKKNSKQFYKPQNKQYNNKNYDSFNYHTFKKKDDPSNFEIREGLTPLTPSDENQKLNNFDIGNQKDEEKESYL